MNGRGLIVQFISPISADVVVAVVFKAGFVLDKNQKHEGRCHSGSESPSQSNMRTHNEGRVVTGIEGTLMQIDPQRPKCQSLLIKLFTTA